MGSITRCAWGDTSENMREYHDVEWGVPLNDDSALFEFLTLEGAQAGLSWQTILNRREGYRKVFAEFEIKKVAAMGPADIDLAMGDPSIIRNRGKIQSTISNARVALEVIEEHGSLSEYLWSFVGGSPIQNAFTEMGQIPASTLVSEAMSKVLKKKGFGFVGPTTCYAFMQATGMVNDHTTDCFRYREVLG